jgi:hypothetical protein
LVAEEGLCSMELKILKADVMKKNPFLTKLAKLSYSGFL